MDLNEFASLLCELNVLNELEKLRKKSEKRKKSKGKHLTPRECCKYPNFLGRTRYDIEANFVNKINWKNSGTGFYNFTKLNINDFEEILALVSIKYIT